MAEKVTLSNGSAVQHSTNNNDNGNKATTATGESASGPKPVTEPKVLALLERTGYPLTQENGQRLYGPPPEWNGPAPARGCEIFVGKIPRDCLEDELIPIFERIGKIYEVRLMMDFNGNNRGYCFVAYTSKSDAKRAVKELNDYEIRRKKFLGVCLSVDNCRLFVGGIPREKQSAEILEEMKKIAEGVVNAIVYPSIADKTKNRGFAFVEFESHRAAAMARRKLLPGKVQMFNHDIAVDWAEPEPEVDEDVMSKVRILYVRNLMLSTTEESLERIFSEKAGLTPGSGGVERVKKLKDYAFIHFRDRNDAVKALNALNGEEIEGSTVEVVFAKPVDRESQHNRHNVQRFQQQQLSGYQGGFAPGYANLASLPLAGAYMPGVYYHQPLMNGGGPPPSGPPTAISPVYNGNRISTNQLRDQSVSRRGQGSRGRTAAGSRGAGGWVKNYSANGNSAYRQHNSGEGVYDLQPGMELIPANTQTIKSHNRSPPQTLEEMCQRNGWGQPTYHLHQAIGPGVPGAQPQLFVFKVLVPGLSPTPFMSNKLCRTIDEAKRIAADFVLQQLGVYTYGSYPTHATGGLPVNNSLGPSTGVYQHQQQ